MLFSPGGMTHRRQPSTCPCTLLQVFGMAKMAMVLRNQYAWHSQNCIPAECLINFILGEPPVEAT